MSKVAHYLQEHLVGEVMTSVDARNYFSTDASVFSITPAIIVYPRNENDVRKTARFAWQLAERGHIIPITPRGAGTDQGGGAIGSGVMLVFPAHLHHILEIDSKAGTVSVEPGTNYGKLQQTLHTHSRFLPPFPSSMEYSTIGGAIANNAGGEKSVKYGVTQNYVKRLRVVLANGEIIETRRLAKRELNKKLGLATFEGEIYRSLDTVLEENHELIAESKLHVTKNTAGYNLWDIKHKDGSFDLTPLLVGSQGTLGIVSEATLATEPYTPASTVIAACFTDIKVAAEVVLALTKFSDPPSALEVVDRNLLDFVQEQNPNLLRGILEPPFPKLVVLIEFDNNTDRAQKRLVKKAIKLLSHHLVPYKVESDPAARDELWKIRHCAATLMAHTSGGARALPIIEDGIVPLEKWQDYIQNIYTLFEKNGLRAAFWGHAGDANLHLQPFLDLSQVGDRQKVFRLIEDYYTMVIAMGGSTSGEHNDGRLRAAFLPRLYGAEMYQLFEKVKQICDPYGIMNPGVKIGIAADEVRSLLRQDYTLGDLYPHMPRS